MNFSQTIPDAACTCKQRRQPSRPDANVTRLELPIGEHPFARVKKGAEIGQSTEVQGPGNLMIGDREFELTPITNGRACRLVPRSSLAECIFWGRSRNFVRHRVDVAVSHGHRAAEQAHGLDRLAVDGGDAPTATAERSGFPPLDPFQEGFDIRPE